MKQFSWGKCENVHQFIHNFALMFDGTSFALGKLFDACWIWAKDNCHSTSQVLNRIKGSTRNIIDYVTQQGFLV